MKTLLRHLAVAQLLRPSRFRHEPLEGIGDESLPRVTSGSAAFRLTMLGMLVAGVSVAIACSGGEDDPSANGGFQEESTARTEDALRVQPYEYPAGTIPVGNRIAIGAHHICASLGDGQHAIKCWGYNADGRLGYGDTVTRGDEPGEMGNALKLVDAYNPYKQLSRVLDVSSFGNNTCVVVDFSDGDGLLHCWGSNQYGQLGITVPASGLSAPYNTSYPEKRAIEVSVGSNFACRRNNAGEVRCLGSGPLGYGDDRPRGLASEDLSNERPVPLGTGLSAKQIAASSVEHACALLNNGQVKCWGRNGVGQLGTGDTLSRGFVPGDLGDELPPVNLGTGRTAKAVAVASYSSCALLDNNQVKCWGSNQDSSLGNGDPTSRTRGNSPEDMGDNLPAVDFGPGLYAKQISSGYNHYCALLNNNQVKCWGANEEGALGIGVLTPKVLPRTDPENRQETA